MPHIVPRYQIGWRQLNPRRFPFVAVATVLFPCLFAFALPFLIY